MNEPFEENELSSLAWQAFRYLADEMTTEERQAYEAGLEHDAAAAESLEQMVELVGQLANWPAHSANPLVAPASGSSSRQAALAIGRADHPRRFPLGAFAWAAAAIVLLATSVTYVASLRWQPPSLDVEMVWARQFDINDDSATSASAVETPDWGTADWQAAAELINDSTSQEDVAADTLWLTANTLGEESSATNWIYDAALVAQQFDDDML